MRVKGYGNGKVAGMLLPKPKTQNPKPKTSAWPISPIGLRANGVETWLGWEALGVTEPVRVAVGWHAREPAHWKGEP